MRYFVIHNPHSRDGRGAVHGERCLALLARGGCAVESAVVRHFEEAHTFSREANLSGYDAVVAVGGDGTINRVLNGFYDDSGARNSDALFGAVHTGTSPDFCRSYGLPLDLVAAAAALRRGHTRRIPVGMIRFGAEAGNGAGIGGRQQPGPIANEGNAGSKDTVSRNISCFACCANIGLGAALATRANSGIRKRIGDTMGTFVSLLQVLRRHEPGNIRLLVDGEEIEWTNVYNISVGLTEFIASGIRVVERQPREPGQFYLLTLRDLNARNLLPVLRKIYSGQPFVNSDSLSLRACTHLSVQRQWREVAVEHDGDPCGELPCTIAQTREGLDLIC